MVLALQGVAWRSIQSMHGCRRPLELLQVPDGAPVPSQMSCSLWPTVATWSLRRLSGERGDESGRPSDLAFRSITEPRSAAVADTQAGKDIWPEAKDRGASEVGFRGRRHRKEPLGLCLKDSLWRI